MVSFAGGSESLAGEAVSNWCGSGSTTLIDGSCILYGGWGCTFRWWSWVPSWWSCISSSSAQTLTRGVVSLAVERYSPISRTVCTAPSINVVEPDPHQLGFEIICYNNNPDQTPDLALDPKYCKYIRPSTSQLCTINYSHICEIISLFKINLVKISFSVSLATFQDREKEVRFKKCMFQQITRSQSRNQSQK